MVESAQRQNRLISTNTSGYPGVSCHNASGKWRAGICRNTDAEWEKDKQNRRDLIQQLGYDTSKADIAALPDKLRSRIMITEEGHWLWLRLFHRNNRGVLQKTKVIYLSEYGRAYFKGKRWAAHKLIYTLLVGEIPPRILIRHVCNTPACVNPAHHQLGIEEDNFQDMVGQGRASWQVKARRRAENCATALNCVKSSTAILKILLRYQKYIGDIRYLDSVHHVIFAAMREMAVQIEEKDRLKGNAVAHKLPPTNRLKRPMDIIRTFLGNEQRLIASLGLGPTAIVDRRLREALLRVTRRTVRAESKKCKRGSDKGKSFSRHKSSVRPGSNSVRPAA